MLSGGDPLKAALAAGQTPSPSAVAAAPVVGVLTPAWAWACVGVAFAGVALTFALGPRTSPLEHVRPPFPPAVLAVKAEEAMRALGQAGACADDATGFAYDNGALRVAAAVGSTATGTRDPARLAEAAAAERRTIVFWQRCSSVPLVPWGQTQVTRDNPPTAPGEVRAELDVDGHLLRYQEEPGASEGPPGRAASDPLATFLRLAALDSTSDAFPPPENGHLSLDVRFDRGVPAKVEADVRGGRLIEARLVRPWSQSPKSRTVSVLGPEDVPNLLIVSLLLASLPIAYRNVKLRRGDREGAVRVGLLVFACHVAGNVLNAGICVLVAGYGLYFSTGGRPFGRRELLEH